MSNSSKAAPLTKPAKQVEHFYDWSEAWDYLKAKYSLSDDIEEDAAGNSCVWHYICDSQDIHNGSLFSFSNWDLIYEGGKYANHIPDWFKPILNHIIDEFGEIDETCITPGTKVAQFRSIW